MNECVDNSLSYDHIVNLTVEDICKKQKFFMSEKLKLNIDLVKKDDTLPLIFLFPKFHKPKLSQRFVISYACCFIKPVAQRLTLGLKAIYAQICRYCSMLFKVTGIKRNWIIDSNAPLLECFNNYLESETARNIQTYDFSTLYTNLKHDEIKIALREVLKIAFKHSKCNFIAIYDKKFRLG